MSGKVGGCLGCGSGRVGAQIVAVVVEEDVLNVLVEGGISAHVIICGWWSSWSDRDTYGYADIGFGSAAVAFGGEMEVSGGRWGDGLGAVGAHVADAVDGD